MLKNYNHYLILTRCTNVLQENRNAQKSIKIIYLKNMPSWALMVWITIQTQVDQSAETVIRALAPLTSAHRSSNTSGKSLNHHKSTNRYMPFYTCKYSQSHMRSHTHARTHIKSLLCKIFQSWGLKRQHISQLSVVHLFPVYLEPSPWPSLCERGRQTAVLLVPMWGRANSTKSSMRTGHAPGAQRLTTVTRMKSFYRPAIRTHKPSSS